MHACEMHAYEMYAREVHVYEIRASKVYVHKTSAYEIHELGRCDEIFDLSLSIPISRHIGDTPGSVFGAKLSAKSVTEISDP
jgi:hypothetical protein